MKKVFKSRIQERGQVTIPMEAREALHLGKGEELLFIIHENEIIIKPLLKNPLEMVGTIGKANDVKSVKELIAKYQGW